MTQQGQGLKVGFDADKGQALQQQVQNKRQATKQSLHDEKQLLVGEQHDLMMEKDEKLKQEWIGHKKFSPNRTNSQNMGTSYQRRMK